MGAKSITIGERSGPPDTSDVIEEKGIYGLCNKLNVKLVNFEGLPHNDWVKIRPEQSHWKDGFDVARPVLDSECIVTTCCLEDPRVWRRFHHISQLSVGITHKRNMTELHSSFRSMRKMIAEINQAINHLSYYWMQQRLLLTEAYDRNQEKADVILAGTDRIA